MASDYVPHVPDDAMNLPVFAQLAASIAADIQRGRLRPGDKLPGSRGLAATLGVHRNTVNAALSELAAQGWVEARPARGVFVRQVQASDEPRPFSRKSELRARVPERLAAPMQTQRTLGVGAPPVPNVLDLRGGLPDARLFPSTLLARAYRRALAREGHALLDYGDARGHPRLRRALSAMLSAVRGLACEADDVLITRGSQQAMWLTAHALLSTGDRVAVESFGYQPAWEALKSAGATLVPVAVDREGMSIRALERVLQEGPVRAVYVTPHHQYPTTVAMSAQRRLRLLELAREHRFVILEDDYTFEFQYDGRPRLPLASVDRDGSVVYLGALSKVLAPGLRIGYAVAPRNLLTKMAEMRTIIDRQGDSVSEAGVAELLEDGEVARHIRKTRRVYHQRRDHLVAEIRRHFGADLSFQVPAGGMAVWARVPLGISVEDWANRAAARDVLVRPGSVMAWSNRKVPFVRLGFTRCNERELTRAVRILRDTYQSP